MISHRIPVNIINFPACARDLVTDWVTATSWFVDAWLVLIEVFFRITLIIMLGNRGVALVNSAGF